ncbi:MAG TPA: peptidoglycan-binding domain-containing protein, partial [Pyrinomonadaceae bacterium]|nr:peptidoglycan-binding domain-containing protein [Pyrinomonadaceae bacterium]
MLGNVTRTVVLSALTLLLAVLPGVGATADGKNRKQNQKLLVQERLELEQLLSDLGYWTGLIDGTLDPASRHALVAFQKVEGRPRTGQPARSELEALRKADKP